MVERYVYTPYGQVTTYNAGWSPTSPAYGNTILYKGMSLDATTGLYYDRARWYDPGTGTYITRDPAQADPNLYRFCGDNPINYVDPTGMKMSWSSNEFGCWAGAWDGKGPILPMPINVPGSSTPIWVMPSLQPDGTYGLVPPPNSGDHPGPGFGSLWGTYLAPWNNPPGTDGWDSALKWGKWGGEGIAAVGAIGTVIVEAAGVGGVVLGDEIFGASELATEASVESAIPITVETGGSILEMTVSGGVATGTVTIQSGITAGFVNTAIAAAQCAGIHRPLSPRA